MVWFRFDHMFHDYAMMLPEHVCVTVLNGNFANCQNVVQYGLIVGKQWPAKEITGCSWAWCWSAVPVLSRARTSVVMEGGGTQSVAIKSPGLRRVFLWPQFPNNQMDAVCVLDTDKSEGHVNADPVANGLGQSIANSVWTPVGKLKRKNSASLQSTARWHPGSIVKPIHSKGVFNFYCDVGPSIVLLSGPVYCRWMLGGVFMKVCVTLIHL